MPERTQYAHGTPSWVDLQTSDQEAAKQFYAGLFGWTFDDLKDDAGNVFYSMALLSGKRVCAIGGLGDLAAQGVPPHWNSYVTVDDVDATTAKVAGAGGTVIAPPFDVMDAGRMSVVQDPTGAMINLWTAKESIGSELVNEPGAFSWNELTTPDVPKAAAFYAELFGWTAMTHEGDMPYTEFQLDGNSIAGAMNPPMPGVPTFWGIYFSVDDTDAAVEKAKTLGGSVFAGPMDIEPGRFAVVADPQGAMFNVIKMAEAAG
jgi:predicted enzyme related to lactoylglutathione lyase